MTFFAAAVQTRLKQHKLCHFENKVLSMYLKKYECLLNVKYYKAIELQSKSKTV